MSWPYIVVGDRLSVYPSRADDVDSIIVSQKDNQYSLLRPNRLSFGISFISF